MLKALADWALRLARRVVLAVARLGPVPRHVAFIMDGNRRFARKLNLQPGDGHRLGFKRLEETLDWCMQLGIQVVTVYAFSIENFKRPKDEVDILMDLAERKFAEFATKSDLIEKHGISVRVVGNVDMLPERVYRAACKVTAETRQNTKAILNICCPYTARNEMANAISEVVAGAQRGDIRDTDICEEAIEKCLYTEDCPPVDILVRTSGEARLSDFLLWQVSRDCMMHFLDILWPEFSFWDMLPILLNFQANYARLEASRAEARIRAAQSIDSLDAATACTGRGGELIHRTGPSVEDELARTQRLSNFYTKFHIRD
nr:hypothetical protein HK105_006873 [Polyrhizophydium stewartii]